ncbi:MAG: hypothetical protein LBF00_04065 [Mycoplasmataceae bacterium]|nr:hypothetical protein [Mycoplasmataceae bacterium]
MQNKTIIIYQSRTKTQNTKHIAETIAQELKCEAIDVSTNPNINLEEYNLIGFGSGVYFWSVGCKLKKWIKSIKWSSPDVAKPDAFIFTTQGAKSAANIHKRFINFLQKKAKIITVSGWACQAKTTKTTEALTDLQQWVNSKLKPPVETPKEQK